jgi:hypothetical protein
MNNTPNITVVLLFESISTLLVAIYRHIMGAKVGLSCSIISGVQELRVSGSPQSQGLRGSARHS